MHSKIIVATLAAALTACQPAPTTMPTAVPATPVPTDTPTPPIMGADVLAAFVAAGLEAEGARPMTVDDYGLAPYVCGDDATRFYVPSLGPDQGGRVYVCQDAADADMLARYYEELGKASAMLHSHVMRGAGGRVLVQINGSLDAETAGRYAAVVAGLGE